MSGCHRHTPKCYWVQAPPKHKQTPQAPQPKSWLQTAFGFLDKNAVGGIRKWDPFLNMKNSHRPLIKFLACLPSRFAKHVSCFFFFPQNYNSKGKKSQTGHKNGSRFWVFQKHVDLETADKKFAGGKSICDKEPSIGVMGPWINVIFFQMWCFTLTLFRMGPTDSNLPRSLGCAVVRSIQRSFTGSEPHR